MNAEDKAHLDAIMKSFQQRLAKSKDAQEQRQTEVDVGYAEFKRVVSETIRPAMEDIGNLPSSRQWAVLSIGGIYETHADTDGIEKDRPRIIDKADPIDRLVEFDG